MKRYRLYVDESGDHTYHSVDDAAKRYLCLLGLFVESEVYRSQFHPALEKLKQDNFPHSPDEPIILHRTELINRRGPFVRLRQPENEERFNKDLLRLLSEQDYKIIGVTIDKKAHIERYGDAAYHPYHYCLAALLERYCGFLNFFNAQGDVIAENRGGTEDSQLKESYRTLLRVGTNFCPPRFFRRPLTSCEIKLKPKSANIAGLQIADLLAHPIKQQILMDKNLISDQGEIFAKEVCGAIASKYNRQVYRGRVEGYSKVFLG